MTDRPKRVEDCTEHFKACIGDAFEAEDSISVVIEGIVKAMHENHFNYQSVMMAIKREWDR